MTPFAIGPAAMPKIKHHFTGKERDTESGNDYFAATVAGIAGPPFANQLPQSLSQELADMAAKGITPQSPSAPGFGEMAEQAAGKVNWTLSTNGELLTTPAVDGVTHAATAGGADLMGAGTAQVSTAGGQTTVFDITAQSGHYMNGGPLRRRVKAL